MEQLPLRSTFLFTAGAALLLLAAGRPVAADPIGPDCDTCQGSIYTLLYDPTPVGTTNGSTIYEITLRIDTSGYDGGGVRIGDVAFKVAPKLDAVSIIDAPGGAGDWTTGLGGLNANGCDSNPNNGFACAASTDAGNAAVPDGTYEWVFNATVPNGTLFTDAFAASIKARYLDGDGEKVGDLVSENITLQVIPEPGTLLLLTFGLTGLARARKR